MTSGFYSQDYIYRNDLIFMIVDSEYIVSKNPLHQTTILKQVQTNWNVKIGEIRIFIAMIFTFEFLNIKELK